METQIILQKLKLFYGNSNYFTKTQIILPKLKLFQLLFLLFFSYYFFSLMVSLHWQFSMRLKIAFEKSSGFRKAFWKVAKRKRNNAKNGFLSESCGKGDDYSIFRLQEHGFFMQGKKSILKALQHAITFFHQGLLWWWHSSITTLFTYIH